MYLSQDAADLWAQSLQACLAPYAPSEVLADYVELIVFQITDLDIQVRPTDQNLSLKELEHHPLCQILQSVLVTLQSSAFPEDQVEPIESFPLLTSTLLDRFLDPAPLAREKEAESKKRSVKACELCARQMPVTIHHLVPRSTHSYFLRHPNLIHPSPSLDDAQIRSKGDEAQLTKEKLLSMQATLCRPCHSQIHKLVPDHRELGTHFNSIEKLMDREDVVRWCAWIQGQRVSDSGMGQRVRYRR